MCTLFMHIYVYVHVEQTWNTARDRDEELQGKEKVKEEGEREGEAGMGDGGNSGTAESGKETNGGDLDSGDKPFVMCMMYGYIYFIVEDGNERVETKKADSDNIQVPRELCTDKIYLSLKPWSVPYFHLSLSLHLYFLFKTEEVSVLEALAASGLRSIRYALEVPAVAHVVANDYSSEAYDNMCRNISHNSVDDKVKPSCREAR